MSSDGTHPLEGICEVDEILTGGKQEGKRGRGAKGKKKASILTEKDIQGEALNGLVGCRLKLLD